MTIPEAITAAEILIGFGLAAAVGLFTAYAYAIITTSLE